MSFVTSAFWILSVVYLALGLIYLRFWLDKRKSLTHLTKTLEQLEMAAAAGNVGMWTRSVDGEILWASEKAGDIWGFSYGERFTQADLVELLHPDDHERVMSCVEALASGKEEYQIEFRIVARDGALRWVQSQGRIEKLNGTPVVRGALVDITKQKMAETAVRQLSHKLITAQETERARVALELHDDLNQNIALLSIQLGMLRKQPKDLAFVSDQLGQFVTDVERLSKDVHRISYDLHPAKLTQLGLEVAVRGFCREFAQKHGIVIDFVAESFPGNASKDTELCLYRVTQESLQNVIKHSKAKTVRVTLKGEADEVLLTIVDDGKGFDINAVRPNRGLGLISIDERAKHVNGTAVIASTLGKGTTVEIRIPIDQEPSLSLHS
jgi:PAS domain S-box-containing protein